MGDLMIKIVFMGTPDFSVPVLKGLIENNNYEVVGVVSQPDKKVGRKQILTPSKISQVALDNNITLLRPEKLRKSYEEVLALNPDMIVTCAYGQIVPKEILDFPKYGCINVHASLLPKYRGGAPIHRSIMNGERETGITIMYMNEGLDTGDIITQEVVPIELDDTTETMHDKLSIVGRNLLLKTIPDIIEGKINRIKQNDEESTYASNISREDEYIDFNEETKKIYDKVRGLNSFPVAFTKLDNKIYKIYSGRISTSNKGTPGEIINIYKDGIGVRTKDGEYIITELKEEGKKRLSAKEYLNGKKKEELIGKRFE